ncbi:MAG: chromosomal replication initiator protein DnaA [Erysipelotrichaceae bacterium]|nr:chromosomal replication initiator protein DnaA [Erysipelotrichaceae bacterium]
MIDYNYYLKNVWDKTISSIKDSKKIEPEIIDTFFYDVKIYEANENKVILLTENIIKKSILDNEKEIIKYYLQNTLETDNDFILEIYVEDQFKTEKLADTIKIPLLKEFDGQTIMPHMTFDNFVVGECNRESHVAALACAYDPGKMFNPLFIYGNSGLGKTHLLCAIGNYVKKNNPNKKVYYTDTLKFVERVSDSIKDGSIDSFKKFMYTIDVLLIDDIQLLANKEKSHEVFFTIFNELVNNRKQICIASDRLPQEIKGIESRLISRFSSGLSVSVDSPEFETSLDILKMKLKNSSLDLDINNFDEEALAFIASNFSKDVRSLEGALTRVIFLSIQDTAIEKIDLDFVSIALKGQTVVSDKSGLSPKKIIKCVADYYNLSKQQITSKTRTKNIAMARHISIYLCRKLLDLPYTKIGDEFGGRDHSTIISACDKVEKQIQINPSYKKAVEELESIITK